MAKTVTKEKTLNMPLFGRISELLLKTDYLYDDTSLNRKKLFSEAFKPQVSLSYELQQRWLLNLFSFDIP